MEVNRRDFLKVLSIGGAAALTGCSAQAPEKLIPYLIPVEEIIPGKATWYATVCRECPAGCGMLVRTREGRAVKVEGNPDHPVNRGRLCARGQASLQGLYNPDRIRQPLLKDASGTLKPVSWDEAEAWLISRLAELLQQGKGVGITWMTPHLTGSPDRLVNQWLKILGSTRRLRYEPFAYEPIRTANRLTFGREVIPTYDLESSTVILAFGADFLETWISPVMYAREFAAMRAYKDGRMGRFIFIGPRLSLTAANADRWISVRPGTEGVLALGLVGVIVAEGLVKGLSQDEVGRIRALVDCYDFKRVSEATGVEPEEVKRLARTFAEGDPGLALGGGTAVSGPHATTTLVAINLLNYVAGNVGRTVRFGPVSTLSQLSTYREMLDLIQAMEKGQVSALFFSEVNPVFTMPKAAGFERALGKVPLVVSCSSFMDETVAKAHLVFPTHTPLESWGDVEPWEGMHGLMQPAMQPLFETKALGDLLLSLAKRLGGPPAQAFKEESFYEYLRARWRELHQRLQSDVDFETFWVEALRRGGVFEAIPAQPVRLNVQALSQVLEEPELAGQADAFVLLPYPSLVHFDGRGADRPWLQELPDPMTQLTWDNWLEVHPEDAKRHGIEEGDLLTVKSPDGEIELPAHLYAGVRPGVVAIPIGQGHTAFGRHAEGRGANPLALLPKEPEPRSGGLPWLSPQVTLARTGKKHLLASVSGSDRQFDRGIAQVIPLAELQAYAGKEPHDEHKVLQMYPPHEHPNHRWGMAIDLNACIGCGACVTACYAENNLAVVGKEEVARGREMSWIRIERYVEGPPERPETRFVPMLCQHCDNAPCEPVCPVYATVHNPEGLNIQVYNRCVGTRYCSNNCPYKVRRFNWFTYKWPEPLNLQLNPDVTVREMGVMEKCTFCVQRITEGKERAKGEGRPVRDGDIVPACAQACPTRAIVFGDLKDPESEVSRLRQNPRRYRVFEHLNTQPAITYLKRIRPSEEA
ncbi:MAG: molybdopterin-dependent oxidoreductase [candidate division NC10 bacterium]|nr:molybdopterin-dependent oxidoreductase [candidate division NC10 bacterium]